MARVLRLQDILNMRLTHMCTYDTTRAVGGPGHSTKNDGYILFDSNRAHIVFKFNYTHAAACRCAMCIA